MAISIYDGSNFQYMFEYSLSWTFLHHMENSYLFLKKIKEISNNDGATGDIFGMYPEIWSAYWMSIMGLELDGVFIYVLENISNNNRIIDNNRDATNMSSTRSLTLELSYYEEKLADLIIDTLQVNRLNKESPHLSLIAPKNMESLYKQSKTAYEILEELKSICKRNDSDPFTDQHNSTSIWQFVLRLELYLHMMITPENETYMYNFCHTNHLWDSIGNDIEQNN